MISESISQRRLVAFWNEVRHDETSGCWLWQGRKNRNGYGRFSVQGRRHMAHKLAFELVMGKPVPGGCVLDHTCRNRNCVNPRHLDPVRSRTNTLRGVGPTACNARKKCCPRGHRYTVRADGRRRRCYTCEAEARRRKAVAA